MQRKLNEEFIKEYSRQFSEKITTAFFDEKETINGKEILNISPSKQVNFFILKILFGNWQEEMKKLESPYFNYRDPEVRRAMVDFMNILSQKIQVDEDHFYELMDEAVNDTLTLAVLPQKFLYDELIQKDINNVNEKVTRPLLKYLKLHKGHFQNFFDENIGMDMDDFLDKSREFFEGVDVQEVVEEELTKLSKIHTVTFDDLLEAEDQTPDESVDDSDEDFHPEISGMDDEDEPDQEGAFEPLSEASPDSPFEDEEFATEEPDKKEEQPSYDFYPDHDTDAEVKVDMGTEEDIRTGTFGSATENAFDNEIVEEKQDDLPPQVEEKIEAHEVKEETDTEGDVSNEPEEGEDIAEETPVDDVTETVDRPTTEKEPEEPDPVNETFTTERSTVNDSFTNEEKFTVADHLEKKKTEKIMEAISVNHRYMFTKELFDGSRDEFNEAVSKIEKCGSFDDAVEMLVHDYAKHRNWDMNSEEVKELLKVVFRKFR